MTNPDDLIDEASNKAREGSRVVPAEDGTPGNRTSTMGRWYRRPGRR
jgi:hypothetical protein